MTTKNAPCIRQRAVVARRKVCRLHRAPQPRATRTACRGHGVRVRVPAVHSTPKIKNTSSRETRRVITPIHHVHTLCRRYIYICVHTLTTQQRGRIWQDNLLTLSPCVGAVGVSRQQRGPRGGCNDADVSIPCRDRREAMSMFPPTSACSMGL